jgi:methionine biosynthesis protein MetW
MKIITIAKLPYKLLRFIKNAIYEIFLRKMPLDDFGNYEEYWEKREKQNEEILFRDKWISNQIEKNSYVLDIGCGNGRFLKYLKSLELNLFLYGIDLSKKNIENLKKNGIDGCVLDLEKENLIEKLNELNIKFDYVVLMEIIEHLYNPESLMEQLKKIKAKKYFVTIPNLGYIIHRLRLFLGGKMPITTIIFHIKEHIRFWTFSDFIYWSKKLGFKCSSYKGQTGFPVLWRLFPSLFASQIIYVLEIDEDYLYEKR